jgi:uncharacterized damage-inducible protein DinB
VQAADICFLFAYDRWATKQVLTVLDGLDSTVWSRPNDVGERGLGSILVHHLGASQRWRIGLQTQGTDDGPEPELEPLPTIDELRQRWQAEWVAVDAWLPTLTDGHVQYLHEGVPPFGRCWSTSSTTAPSTEPRRRRSSPARVDHQANWT